MTDEEKKVETGEKVDDMTQDYLAAIKELKENSVDRKQYEEVLTENRKLLQSIVDGRETEKQVEQEVIPTVQELRKELFNSEKELSNLEFAEKALQLRSQLINSGEPDPFLPIGNQISPSREDIDCANKVAETLKECIEYAEGDSAVFTNELQRRTVDVKLPR